MASILPSADCIELGSLNDATALPSPNNSPHGTRTRPIAFLDGLRGFAALLVLFFHYAAWFYGGDDDVFKAWGFGGRHYLLQLPFLRTLISGGSAAVAVFFVLSGYVLSIAPLHLVAQDSPRKCFRALASAALRRPFRLYLPPLMVSLAFALTLQFPPTIAPYLGWPVPEASLTRELYRWAQETAIVLNPFVKHGTQERWFPYDPPAWTMPVELQGSVLVFMVLAVLANLSMHKRFIIIVVVGLVLMLIHAWENACFVAGVVLRINDLSTHEEAILTRRRRRTVLHSLIFLCGWLFLSVPAVDERNDADGAGFGNSLGLPGTSFLDTLMPATYERQPYRWWQSWGSVMLVYGVLRIAWLQRFFETRPLQYLGRVSFSLYLMHIPLLWLINDRVFRVFGTIRQEEVDTIFDNLITIPDFGIRGITTRFLISMLFISPLTLLFAEIGTRALDQPSVKVGSRIARSLGLGKT